MKALGRYKYEYNLRAVVVVVVARIEAHYDNRELASDETDCSYGGLGPSVWARLCRQEKV